MQTFKRSTTFSDLPFELRESIWLLCLPHRIFEFEYHPWPEFLWGKEYPTDELLNLIRKPPCQLWFTKRLGDRLPLIAAVCREARDLVLRIRTEQSRAVQMDSRQELSEDTQGFLTDLLEPAYPNGFERWIDFRRSSPHSHIYGSLMEGCDEDPLRTLAEMASFCQNEASFNFSIFEKGEEGTIPARPDTIPRDLPPPMIPEDKFCSRFFGRHDFRQAVDEDSQGLIKHESWQVVMGIIVIHSTASRAAGAGFFGLLGDAPIEIVRIADQDRVQALLQLAKICEEDIGTTSKQTLDDAELVPTDLDLARRRLEYTMWHNGYGTHLYDRLHPALMFRLCTHACHLIDSAGYDQQHKCRSGCDLT